MCRARAIVLLACALSGCVNRAALRIPGAAGSFHAARTGYVARDTAPREVRIATPTDTRSAHYEERVAGTRWTGCDTDPFHGEGTQVVAREIERELRETRLFRAIAAPDDPDALVLDTEIRTLCARAYGFLWIRVAGITSLHFTLRDGDRAVYDRTIEKVVTDADDEYTGSQVTFIEQAMKVLLSDSLRGVFSVLVRDLDRVDIDPPAKSAPAG